MLPETRNLSLPLGTREFILPLPHGIEPIIPPHASILPEAQTMDASQIEAALRNSGASLLPEAAARARRVCILTGDMTLPAPYHEVLPILTAILIEKGVRPSRITLCCCPGIDDTARGRAVVRRFGSDIACGFEILPWRDGTSGPDYLDENYEKADLRIGAFLQHPEIDNLFAAIPQPHFSIALSPGKNLLLSLQELRLAPEWPKLIWDHRVMCSQKLLLSTGGGAPYDATLEEALSGIRALIWHMPRPSALKEKTIILCFDGSEGLGSAHFTQGLYDWLEGADSTSGATTTAPCWTPLRCLYESVEKYGNRLILYSPGLSTHADGEVLKELLLELPTFQKVKLVGEYEAFLDALGSYVPDAREILALPLGWRSSGAMP